MLYIDCDRSFGIHCPLYERQNSLPFDWLIVSPLLKHIFYPFLFYLSMQSSKLWQQLSLNNICSWLWNSLDSCSETSLPSRLSKRHILSLISSGGKTLSVWKTLFIKINDRNTLFTHYNIHDKVCFLFNNIDSHISRLAANLIFQAFERRKKHS